jgi:ribose/xylose/arabinose/galactoside ABC-type transport system permease subunit
MHNGNVVVAMLIAVLIGLAFGLVQGYLIAYLDIQPFIVTLDPSDEPADLVCHRGEEFNLCLKGKVIVTFADQEILLEAGDSIYFNPNYPHGQKCGGDEPGVFLTVIAE